MKILNNLLFAFTIVALFATGALAQGQASITASANVVTDVTLTGVRGLDFGVLTEAQVDAGETIALDDAVADLGKFEMTSLSNGQDVVFTLSAPSVLTPTSTPDLSGGTSQDDIPFEAIATYTEIDETPGGGTDDFTAGTLSKTVGATTAYVYVGGSLNPLSVDANYQGQYTGDITLSVYYD
ncbi:MAG: hypothetical protein WD059_01765 [Balneolaceae bacterium]